jgi:hypothetical protein
VDPGRKWIYLIGRDGCTSPPGAGWAGTNYCNQNDNIRTWTYGGGVRSTWFTSKAPSVTGNPTNLIGKKITFQVCMAACEGQPSDDSAAPTHAIGVAHKPGVAACPTTSLTSPPLAAAFAARAPSWQIQCRAASFPGGGCPARSYFGYSGRCPDSGVSATALSTNTEWVLERAPAVAGQPNEHGQFYIRAAVSLSAFAGS